MAEKFDLFGEPIPENWGRRGRPAHVRTTENINKVMMLLALGWSNERMSNALGITLPTFRKHYFSLTESVRDNARDALDAAYAMKVWTAVMEGNVGAQRLWAAFIEKSDRMGMERKVEIETEAAPAVPVGKKAADNQRALDADSDLMAELDKEAALNDGPSRH